jgi:hypothetical protein
VHDASPLLLLLLTAAGLAIVVQSWRLRRESARARTHEAAATREGDRFAGARARSARASDGEIEAAALLERQGYDVLDRQVLGSWTVRADGEPVTFGLRADYLVARDGRRYIAEVKTGRLAPRLSHGPTRRQLLEYSAAFDVHGVVLVDADTRAITHVEVGDLPARSRRQGHGLGTVAVVAVMLFTAGLVVGTALAR